MDEPTTHLDIGSIDALISALDQFEGTLIFISHDVHFIRAIARSVLHISAGQLTPYAGDYQYYLDKTRATSARAALTAGEGLRNSQPGATASVPVDTDAPMGLRELKKQRRAEAEERKAAARDQREKEKRVSTLEMQILILEGRQKELAAALEDPAAYEPGGRAMELNRELSAVIEDLARINAQWESAAAEVQPAD
jgi:ATP-binding cassette subfamily F protein 3